MQPLSTLQKEGGQKALKHPKDKLLKANAEYIYGENVVYLSLALSWLAKANLAAFSCSLANLFSYLDTFLTPHLSEMTLCLSAAFLSCSFLSSSAAFLRNNVRSFFFLSGVIKPFFLAILLLSRT